MPVSFKLLFIILLAGGLAVLVWQHQTPAAPVDESVVKSVTLTPRSYFEPLVPWMLGEKAVFASLANTNEARELGLSHTTQLPEDIVKVFVFDRDERWSFWMKDMHYPIDMVWVTASGTITYIAGEAKPETYPATFTPPVPSRYVIETVPGLFATLGLKVGDALDMAPIIENN